MNIYKVYMDDGRFVFKTFVPAKSIKALREQWGGNGEFVKIEDVTAEMKPDAAAVATALTAAKFTKDECSIITRLIENAFE